MCTQPPAVETTNSACVGNVAWHGAASVLPLPLLPLLTAIAIDTLVSAAPDISVCVTFTSIVGTPKPSLLTFNDTVIGATSNVDVVGCGVHAGDGVGDAVLLIAVDDLGVYVTVNDDHTA